MNLQALRRISSRVLLSALGVVSAILLASCGGGGSEHNDQGGSINLLPSAGTFYAGVPYTFTIAGGRPPYQVSSSEPTLFAVPSHVNGQSFTVIPANPGVIDANLPPGALPGRTVIVTVRDNFLNFFSTPGTGGLFVAQNFLTGYGLFIIGVPPQGNDCEGGVGVACAGNDSIIQMQAVFNGNLFGGRQFRLEVIRGTYQFVVPETPSNPPAVLSNTVTVISDHTGTITARIRVPASATTQFATIRVIDVATGVYSDQVFLIQRGEVTGTLTALPNSVTFTGPRVGVCGTGSATFLVFDGTPPYTAVSSNPSITVQPTSTSQNPGQFTLTALSDNTCVTDAAIVITDSLGRRATVTVTTQEGSATLPDLAVQPGTVSLGNICGFTASATAVGGQGAITVNSTHPRVRATISGNIISITRLAPDPQPAPPNPTAYPTSAVVTVTDGASIQTITVTGVAPFCP